VTPLRTLAIALAILAGVGLFILPQYLLADPAPRTVAQLASASDTAASPDRTAVEGIVRDYLLENPEILREMADRLKLKDEAKADADRADVFENAQDEIYNSQYQIALGNVKGDVTIVEFFDYNCGYCKHAVKDTEALLESDPNVRLVLKEFPVLSQDSVDAARVAIAVSQQAPQKYLEFHRKLLGSDSASGERAIEVARELGFDIERLSADLTDPKVEASLIAVQKLAKRLGINGTPTYVIGNHVLPGAVGYDALKEAVANVRKCGKAMCS
jgi:protein-disulfide isomerase